MVRQARDLLVVQRPGSNGKSIDDLFAPEIDSQAVEPNGVPYPIDGAWTDDNAATKQNDTYKVEAVDNWINGHDHAGRSEGRHAGDLRDELPDSLDSREAQELPQC